MGWLAAASIGGLRAIAVTNYCVVCDSRASRRLNACPAGRAAAAEPALDLLCLACRLLFGEFTERLAHCGQPGLVIAARSSGGGYHFTDNPGGVADSVRVAMLIVRCRLARAGFRFGQRLGGVQIQSSGLPALVFRQTTLAERVGQFLAVAPAGFAGAYLHRGLGFRRDAVGHGAIRICRHMAAGCGAVGVLGCAGAVSRLIAAPLTPPASDHPKGRLYAAARRLPRAAFPGDPDVGTPLRGPLVADAVLPRAGAMEAQ